MADTTTSAKGKKKPIWPWAVGAGGVALLAILLWPKSSHAASTQPKAPPGPPTPPGPPQPKIEPVVYVPPEPRHAPNTPAESGPYIRGYGKLGVPCKNGEAGVYDDIAIRKAIAQSTDRGALEEMYADLVAGGCMQLAQVVDQRATQLRIQSEVTDDNTGDIWSS